MMADPTPSTPQRPVFKRYSVLEGLNEVLNDDDSDQGDFEDPLSSDLDEEETDNNLHHPLLVEAMGDDDRVDLDYIVVQTISSESEAENDPDYKPVVVLGATSSESESDSDDQSSVVQTTSSESENDPDYQPGGVQAISRETESDPDYQYQPNVLQPISRESESDPDCQPNVVHVDTVENDSKATILAASAPSTAPPPVLRGHGRGVSKRRGPPKRKTSTRGRGRRKGRGLCQSDLVSEWKPARAQAPNPNVSFTANPGLKVDVTDFGPVDYMQLFLNDDLIDHLVAQTNLYADQFLEAHPDLPQFSRANSWEPVDSGEMKKFLGLVLLMGIVRLPAIELYWSTRTVYRQTVFSSVMIRNRFQIILQFLHFNNNATMPPRGDPQYDRLYKIRPVLDHLHKKFQEVYEPRRAVCVDETLLLWKGRLIFRQHIPLKHARCGIKLYLCCESDGEARGSGGYCYRFKVCAGKDDPISEVEPVLNAVDANPPNLSDSEKMVVYLLAPLLNKGYHVYTDSWSSSLQLYLFLLEKNTLACGTVKESRGVPQELQEVTPTPGSSVAVCGDGKIVATKYHSTKVVHLLSTAHGHKETAVQQGLKSQPQVSASHSRNMGGVHRQNQLLQPYDCTRKSMKWTKKLFFHFLQVAACNAFILSKPDENSPKSFLNFLDSLLCSWLFPDNTPVMEERSRSDDEVRLTERHFAFPIPPTAKKIHPQRPCRVCSKRLKIRRDIRYHCPYCPSRPALCIPQCFVDYHTKFKYWQ